MKAQEWSLKVAVYLLGGLFILLIITTTWLLSDNAFLQLRGVHDHECSIVTSPLPTKLHIALTNSNYLYLKVSHFAHAILSYRHF